MSIASDDDVAANRKKHSDGSDTGATPVSAPVATWRDLLSRVTINIATPQGTSDLWSALNALCAGP